MADAAREVSFHCKGCGQHFKGEPSRMVPVEWREWQPVDYFADCARCGDEAPQAAWELNLAKAWANATGARTAEGKAAVTANLPEDTRRTRFNAMKHGLFAKTAQYWPAKPGKYPHCETCEHFNKGCDDDNHRSRERQNPVACLKRIEVFMKFQIAFETRDPRLLTDNMATMQALAWQLTNDMILSVIQDGVRTKTPEWYYDKDGAFHWAEGTDDQGNKVVIHKLEAHPLLRFVIEFMNRNGMTLPDSGMTMKVRDEEEDLRGFLAGQTAELETDSGFRERQTKALETLASAVRRSEDNRGRDPVLIEQNALETKNAPEGRP